MGYSLDDFNNDVRSILGSADDRDSREQVRQRLERLLGDATFCARHIGDDARRGVQQIYSDPQLGFCVLAYNMDAPRTSPPHDHGNSWAVYGQASGHTDMTIWQAAEDDPGRVTPVRSFRLEPGQAGLFDVGEIHSIEYTEGARFVRVTGIDMSTARRRVWDAEAGTVREIEHIGTGSAR